MSSNSRSAHKEVSHARPGKYLTFELGDENYGIAVLNVHEIIRMTDVTRVPRTPGFVRGVINLRGKIVPVVDMRRKFGLEEVEDTERTCIVVVQCSMDESELSMGLIVDEVSEVLDIEKEDIESSPWLGAGEGPSFVLGMAKIPEGVLILLDIERVLTTGEAEVLSEMSAVSGDEIETDRAPEVVV